MWLAAMATVAGHMLAYGFQLQGALALALLVFGHAILLGTEFVLMVIVNRREANDDVHWGTAIRAWWSECWAAARVFGWQQPFRNRDWPDRLPARQTGRRGVLLVHGFACSRGLWLHWLERLHARGDPYIAVDLEPPWAAIDHHRRVIEDAVSHLEHATGLAPVVVAHSMGGLAARAWWTGTTPDRIHRLLTEGHARRSRTTCYYSVYDNIVFPARSATLDGAENRLLAGEAHLHMVWHPAIWAEALEWLGLQPQAAPHRR
jgi:predicted alpha/beta hydrolase family esterase